MDQFSKESLNEMSHFMLLMIIVNRKKNNFGYSTTDLFHVHGVFPKQYTFVEWWIVWEKYLSSAPQ